MNWKCRFELVFTLFWLISLLAQTGYTQLYVKGNDSLTINYGPDSLIVLTTPIMVDSFHADTTYAISISPNTFHYPADIGWRTIHITITDANQQSDTDTVVVELDTACLRFFPTCGTYYTMKYISPQIVELTGYTVSSGTKPNGSFLMNWEPANYCMDQRISADCNTRTTGQCVPVKTQQGCPIKIYDITSIGCDPTTNKIASVCSDACSVPCFGDSADFTLLVSGGYPPFDYAWSNGTFNDTLFNVPAGTYYVTITDSMGIIHVDSIVVSQPTAIGSTAIITADCDGNGTGSLNMTTYGGCPPYSYVWSNGATTEDLSNVHNGFYNVTITDVNGCSVVQKYTIGEAAWLSTGLAQDKVSLLIPVAIDSNWRWIDPPIDSFCYVVDTHPTWNLPPPQSMWVAKSPLGNQALPSSVDTFIRVFPLLSIDPSLRLELEYNFDSIGTILLNGQVLVSNHPLNVPGSFVATSTDSFRVGLDTLMVIVTNSGPAPSPQGFALGALLTACPGVIDSSLLGYGPHLPREEQLEIQLFPNPTSDQFNLRFAETVHGSAEVKVYDLYGRQVWYQPHVQPSTQTTIPLPNCPPGCYIVQVTVGGNLRKSFRLIVE